MPILVRMVGSPSNKIVPCVPQRIKKFEEKEDKIKIKITTFSERKGKYSPTFVNKSMWVSVYIGFLDPNPLSFWEINYKVVNQFPNVEFSKLLFYFAIITLRTIIIIDAE